MGLFFFLAGYFSPGAFDRKGAIDFLRDRGRRLGLPLLFGTFAIVPIAGWAHLALDPATPPVSYWTYLTKYFPPQGPLHRYLLGDAPKPAFWPEWERWPAFNFGHLWFLEHLLVYALLYAAVRAFIPADRGSAARNRRRMARLPPMQSCWLRRRSSSASGIRRIAGSDFWASSRWSRRTSRNTQACS